jgi:hypothetical protein
MMYASSILVFLVATVLAQQESTSQNPTGNQNIGEIGGIFGVNLFNASRTVSASVLAGLIAMGSESPTLSSVFADEVAGGTGLYKASYRTDSSLPNHTIYAPTSPPEGIKMPVMAFANGSCLHTGNMYPRFLTEVASHGYLVIANGVPGGLGLAKINQLTDAINWVMKENNTKKYGSIDTNHIAVSGQSCGGLEAYSASKSLVALGCLTLMWNCRLS